MCGLELPYQVFFEPTTDFMLWLHKATRCHTIFDCGAGVGFLGATWERLFADKRFFSLDMHPREKNASRVLIADARYFSLPSGCVALICRPSAGEWIQEVINNALQNGAAFVLYVAKSANVERDLDDLPSTYQTSRMFEHAGAEDEVVMKIELKVKTFKTFVLVRQPFYKETVGNWYERLEGGRLGNSSGGWMLEGDCVIDQTVEAEDFEDLDWKVTALYRKNQDGLHGWLAPDGTFYACEYMAHDRVAWYLFKSPGDELAHAGWIRVQARDGLTALRYPTEAQYKTAKERGIVLQEETEGRRKTAVASFGERDIKRDGD